MNYYKRPITQAFRQPVQVVGWEYLVESEKEALTVCYQDRFVRVTREPISEYRKVSGYSIWNDKRETTEEEFVAAYQQAMTALVGLPQDIASLAGLVPALENPVHMPAEGII